MRDSDDWTSPERARLEDLGSRLAAGIDSDPPITVVGRSLGGAGDLFGG